MSHNFDLHCHPSFRSFISTDNKDDCWKSFGFKSIINLHPNWKPIFQSQSSLSQMKSGNVKLAVAAICVIEKAVALDWLFSVVEKVSYVDRSAITNSLNKDAFDLFHEELNGLRSSNISPNKRVNILNKMSDYDDSSLNLILALEGSHGLKKVNSLLANNLRSLKQVGVRILYLTLVHMDHFEHVGTNAFGMKMLKHDGFKPKGKGLRQGGYDLIDEAYSEENGLKRIFIDIKHMSLQSRKDFYMYRFENEYIEIPIIASHIAFTGISWEAKSISKTIRKKEYKKDGKYVQVMYDKPVGFQIDDELTEFNPWSINLYNEEIVKIIESNGLMGIILDQRMLGAQNINGEYFSNEEFEDIVTDDLQLSLEPFYLDEFESIDQEDEDFLMFRDAGTKKRRDKHLRYLCNQILHAVYIDEKAWDHICIGSDSDGLIDPIDLYDGANDFPEVEKEIINLFKRNKDVDFNGKYLLKDVDIEKAVRGIFFENAKTFLNEYFI